jgi:glycosyltransferase involved in cell wall biosynthesis
MTNSPLRVAIFTDTFAPQMNGVARTLGRLRAELERRGHAALVFAPSDPRGPSNDAVTWPSVSFWAYPELRLSWPSRGAVRGGLSAWAPSIVHVATPFGIGLAGARAAHDLGVPLVTSYHTSLSEYARFYGLGAFAAPGWEYLRWFHNRGRRTFVPTAAICNELGARRFERLRVWPRGVDTDAFSPRFRSAEMRRSWNADEDTIVIAYVGRIAKEKSVGLAIQAAARLVGGDRKVAFVVVGEGPFEREARAMAPARTVFTGRLSGRALATAYASADILVFPSVTDTFGNVMLEGMASGLAIVAADVPQSREVCAVGNAELFAPENVDDLARSLEGLVANRFARDTLRARALTRAQACGWKTVFDDLFADYHAVASASDIRLIGERATRGTRAEAMIS